jgi:hypothetical protein
VSTQTIALPSSVVVWKRWEIISRAAGLEAVEGRRGEDELSVSKQLDRLLMSTAVGKVQLLVSEGL